MSRTLTKTYGDQLREIIEEYREAGEPWPATARDIATWAYNNGRWEPRTTDVVKQCADDLSRAMREEYYVDPQGRTVRVKHAAYFKRSGRQQMLWDDIRSAPPEHMERSVKLRRQQIVGDCFQLKQDGDSYNDNNSFGANIPLSLNFEKDVAEADAVEKPTAALRKERPR